MIPDAWLIVAEDSRGRTVVAFRFPIPWLRVEYLLERDEVVEGWFDQVVALVVDPGEPIPVVYWWQSRPLVELHRNWIQLP